MQPCIRPATEPDLAAADRVLRAAFARQASFIPHMRLHRAMQPDLLFVAEQHGTIVGTASAVHYGQIAYIGLMAVDPASQRRGIARRLVERLLAELDARGAGRILLDATDSGEPLYASLGFVERAQAAVFELHQPRQLPVESTGIAVTRAASLAELVAFDAVAFGADREKLLAPLLRRDAGRLLAARDAAGTLQGYLFARDPVLGPWVAAGSQASAALLAAALALPYEYPPQVMVPRGNPLCCELLTAAGFTRQRTLSHMGRGQSHPLGQQENRYGQSSFAHG